MAKKLLNPADDVTEVAEIEIPEARQKRLLEEKIQEALEKAKQKEIDFVNLAREELAKKLEHAKKHDTKYYGTSFDKLPKEIQELEMQRMDEDARWWAEKVQKDPSLKGKNWAEYVFELRDKHQKELADLRLKEQTNPNLASQLDDIGPQGSLLRQKLEEAGIDVSKAKTVSDLKSPRSTPPVSSTPYIIPMDERARIIDVDALKRADALDKLKRHYANEANKKALATLGKTGKFLGGGLGALAFASDMEDNNEVAAAIDLANTGLGLFGGKAGQAAAVGLETFRPSLTQTEEQEQDALKEHRFKLLKRGLAKKGFSPEI